MAKDQFGFGMEVSDKSFKEIKSLLDGSELDIGKYFGSTSFEEWTSSPWKKEDTDFLRILISKTADSYKINKPSYVPESSWNEEYMEQYSKILQLASQKKGAPKPEEIHSALRKQ